MIDQHSAVVRTLKNGLQHMGLTVPIDPFLQYLDILETWNRTYNLTAVRDPLSMVTRHLLDSLAILPWLSGVRVLDVGSGAGLPGIPLALARSDIQVVLLDSNGKKVRFLQEVVRLLSLSHVDVVQTRVEAYHPGYAFDTITSRALSDLDHMIRWTSHLIAPDGIWLAMKGRVPEAELQQVTQTYRVEKYTVASLEGERCCIILKNVVE